MPDDFPCCTPAPFTPEPNWARIAVLQTERAYLDRELIRAGNHTRATPTPDSKRYYAINDLIRKELHID